MISVEYVDASVSPSIVYSLSNEDATLIVNPSI